MRRKREWMRKERGGRGGRGVVKEGRGWRRTPKHECVVLHTCYHDDDIHRITNTIDHNVTVTRFACTATALAK